MTLFMPPIQRKKKVEEKYNPDTFRVVSEHAVSDHPKYRPLPYRASFEPRTPTPGAVQKNNNAGESGPYEIPFQAPPRPLKNTRVLPQLLPDFRANKPQTRSCGVLDKNVRFLNEPICNVYTRPVQHEEKQWWPTRANPGELLLPPYAEDTNYRCDYNYRQGKRPEGSGRHTANSLREAARGTIPVNYLREADGSQRLYKEGMSYEHMYNSRRDPNYPIRGKRHGAFVWSKMDPISQRKFIEYYQKLEEDEKNGLPTSPIVKSNSATSNQSMYNVCSGKNGTTSPKRKSSVSSVLSKNETSNSLSGQPITGIPATEETSGSDKDIHASQETEKPQSETAGSDSISAPV